MHAALALAAPALVCCAAATGEWDRRAPDQNADRVVGIFRDLCIEHLGRSAAVGTGASKLALEPEPGGFGRSFHAWSSPLLRIRAHDHSAFDPTDECELDVARTISPSADAAIAALHAKGIVAGEGLPAEFGAMTFREGDRLIFVRYDTADEVTGVSEADAGLKLLIRQPAR